MIITYIPTNDCKPGFVLCTLHVLSHQIFTLTPWGKHISFPHFTGKESEAQSYTTNKQLNWDLNASLWLQ